MIKSDKCLLLVVILTLYLDTRLQFVSAFFPSSDRRTVDRSRQGTPSQMSSATHRDESQKSPIYDVIVVGGGVVGLAILRDATLKGWRCALIEREKDLLHWASGSNSGIVCTGVDASPNSLERALIRDSVSQIRIFLKEMNIPHRPCGSLVCEWPWDAAEMNRLDDVLLESHEAGDTHARKLSAMELSEMEANLNRASCGAVHIPGEIVVDPWLYSIALATHARENNATILTNFAMDTRQTKWDGSIWSVARDSSVENDACEAYDGPTELMGRVIVSATGLWADEVQEATLGKAASFSAKPRRGQYLAFASNLQTKIYHPIQPVPTQRTKGIFVFSSVYDQIFVGPTADDQESKTDREVDPDVAKRLSDFACKILPAMKPKEDFLGEYVGIRPGTTLRDYQIRAEFAKRWITVAGVRSTGLTASLGIGRHVSHLISHTLEAPQEGSVTISTTPLPSVDELIRDFHTRGDKTVLLHGHLYSVTHPITRMGWEARTGMASGSQC